MLSFQAVAQKSAFALGARATVPELATDPHPLLARLRAQEPVSWLPALDGWLVTRHDLALAVMRDAAAFTVDDPRFSTARVVGPSMLSLDGDQHARHRAPFMAPFRLGAVRERFTAPVAAEVGGLIDGLLAAGRAELRASFAGPLAASIVTRALGLGRAEADSVLGWYTAIAGAVSEITAGGPLPTSGSDAFATLHERLRRVIAKDDASLLATVAGAGSLSADEVVSNAAVLLFGGIETTEGMIANAVLALLEEPDLVSAVRADPALLDGAIEESLRLEPAAAVIDRYAVTDAEIGGASVQHGDLVRISISATNRDPAVFGDPDRFVLGRPDARRHLAFAQGPHVCVGVHLARLETRTALAELIGRLPRLRLDPERPARVRGLVFRKPPRLDVVWG